MKERITKISTENTDLDRAEWGRGRMDGGKFTNKVASSNKTMDLFEN